MKKRFYSSALPPLRPHPPKRYRWKYRAIRHSVNIPQMRRQSLRSNPYKTNAVILPLRPFCFPRKRTLNISSQSAQWAVAHRQNSKSSPADAANQRSCWKTEAMESISYRNNITVCAISPLQKAMQDIAPKRVTALMEKPTAPISARAAQVNPCCKFQKRCINMKKLICHHNQIQSIKNKIVQYSTLKV